MTERNDFGAFLAGMIVGGALGAIVALLYAPQPGEEVRNLLKEKSVELKDRAATVSGEARSKLEKTVSQLQEQVAELSRTLQEQVVVLKERGRGTSAAATASEDVPADEGSDDEGAVIA